MDLAKSVAVASTYTIVKGIEDIWDEGHQDNQLSGYSTGLGSLSLLVEYTLT